MKCKMWLRRALLFSLLPAVLVALSALFPRRAQQGAGDGQDDEDSGEG